MGSGESRPVQSKVVLVKSKPSENTVEVDFTAPPPKKDEKKKKEEEEPALPSPTSVDEQPSTIVTPIEISAGTPKVLPSGSPSKSTSIPIMSVSTSPSASAEDSTQIEDMAPGENTKKKKKKKKKKVEEEEDFSLEELEEMVLS